MGLLFRAAAFIAARTKITRYCKLNTGCQGILLENSNTAAFTNQVTTMVGALGLTIALSGSPKTPARPLILLPPTLDRELIAHRLQASLGAGVLVCFAANNPDKALELIQPYW
jgi:hypothetical protein